MIPKADCHLHTIFSPDGTAQPEAMVLRAIELGLKHICITDHMDNSYFDPGFKQFDKYSYYNAVSELKEKYAGQIYINVGLEVGYTSANFRENEELLKKRPFDYVITSVHEVAGTDCYYPHHFDGKTRDEAFAEYFEAVLDSVNVDYRVDALGHIGYITRVAPYKNRVVKSGEFADIIDEIFRTVIKRDIIVELNTSAKGAPVPFIPNPEILQRYYDLGGRKICPSSDAHDTVRIADGYTLAASIAKEIGFDGWTLIENNKHIKVSF